MGYFDPNPRFEDHMVHWPQWALHYKNADGPTGTLARMLGYALDEIDRLRELGQRESKAHAALLFAYIYLVETGKAVPFSERDETMSVKGAWESIQLLNKWRAENKLNIKAVDIA